LINRIAELDSGNKTAWRLAVVISAIVFGVVHFDWGLAGMVQAGFMGLALALSYILVKRNLWITILAHAYMDAILPLQMYFKVG
jgi:membrane protease YdiL (CAAX protease family)